MRSNEEIMTIIERQMAALDISANEVARRTGIAKSAMSRYMNRTREFPLNRVGEFANALRLTPEYLLGFDERAETISLTTIPVVSKVSAGKPTYSEENIEEYISIPDAKENTFGLIVTGDSMDKEFKEGDIVVVDKDSPVENGQIGVVTINGYNGTVKRIKYNENSIILIPESNNAEHYPQIYNSTDEVTIVGKVTGAYKRY